MDAITRQFSFDFHGLEVYCTANLYPDGSLQDITIDYIMEGMIDWLAYAARSGSSIIRLIRRRAAMEIRQKAFAEVLAALATPYDVYDFDNL